MARTKGSKNKPKESTIETTLMSAEARVELLANLLVEQLMTDKQKAASHD